MVWAVVCRYHRPVVNFVTRSFLHQPKLFKLTLAAGAAVLAVGAHAQAFPAAGKTGNQEGLTAWFIGYTPQVVTAVWVGNDDNSPLRQTGGNPLFMLEVIKGWLTHGDATGGAAAQDAAQPPLDTVALTAGMHNIRDVIPYPRAPGQAEY